jgi:hypothetical protein
VAENVKRELRTEALKLLDLDSVLKDILLDWKDVDFENTSEWCSLSLVQVTDANTSDQDYVGFMQIDVASKKRNEYSIDDLEAAVLDLFKVSTQMLGTTFTFMITGVSTISQDETRTVINIDFVTLRCLT